MQYSTFLNLQIKSISFLSSFYKVFVRIIRMDIRALQWHIHTMLSNGFLGNSDIEITYQKLSVIIFNREKERF